MDVLLIDDSVPFDGYTPASQPLGGIEKNFASLPGALARAGHDVRAFNRCGFAITAENVQWLPWNGPHPSECDVLIAYRKPALLDQPIAAKRRILWLANPAGHLASKANREILARHADVPLVFAGEAHRATCPEAFAERAVIVAPGVRSHYLEAEPMAAAHPPRAVVTTHPLMDLDWLLQLWTGDLRKRVPEAELHIYSATLDKGMLGGDVPANIHPVFERVRAAAADGVVVHRPLADPDMADAYRAARVHLYPGAASEVYCSTLAESQAVGLPAVSRRLPAAAERIRDSESGFVVPDDEAFANCAMLLLQYDQIFEGRSAEARDQQRGRDWDAVAAEFAALFS